MRMSDGKDVFDQEAWERLTGVWEGYAVGCVVFLVGALLGLAVEVVLLWWGMYPGATGLAAGN